MSISNGLVLYLVIWWISLFIFLPLGIKKQKNIEKGFDPGAPENPNLKRKFILNSLFSGFVWVLIFLIFRYFM